MRKLWGKKGEKADPAPAVSAPGQVPEVGEVVVVLSGEDDVELAGDIMLREEHKTKIIGTVRDIPQGDERAVEVWTYLVSVLVGELGPEVATAVMPQMIRRALEAGDKIQAAEAYDRLVVGLLWDTRQTSCQLLASSLLADQDWRIQHRILDSLLGLMGPNVDFSAGLLADVEQLSGSGEE